ncbi:MAG: peptide chain release factor N(5)-glutamine methyltransferase [Corticimicrobacter sp.]|uniref:peptide chain release factor N(5)-glutamine methyltransferase n=1 Tax=Corticimicrobacter sp. TaxID=2678536 RepID=UPI0032DAB5AE
MSTVRSLTASCRLPRLETRMLLEQALRRPRAWLLAHDDEPLPEAAVQLFLGWVRRREAGEPMAYLLGEREFMGWVFEVTPDVLIPRPDTETLVETALDIIRDRSGVRVLDMGTGSGAIAISLALACPGAVVHASDASNAALAVARRNGERLGAAVQWRQGDWYAALADVEPGFDLIVSNPPYIACEDPHLVLGDLRFEPATALTDGADGLRDLCAIVQGAGAWLRPGGWLWLEHGWDQAPAVRALLQAHGFAEVSSRCDLAGTERISGGRL